MMASAANAVHADEARHAEVWEVLGTVVDPELDEPVTDMGFVSRIDVDAGDCVHIDFRLPTYWCAANFAFMMASDMREVLLALPWVKGTRIVLGEHMYADKINSGIAGGLSFQDTFGDEADGNLDEVRQTFLVKAFQRRQEALIHHLMAEGATVESICAMSIADLPADRGSEEGKKLVARYLDRRAVVGPYLALSQAFVTAEGQSLHPDGLVHYLTGLRRVRANAEFNGALCRGLLAVRFDMETPLPPRTTAGCRAKAASTETTTNIE